MASPQKRTGIKVLAAVLTTLLLGITALPAFSEGDAASAAAGVSDCEVHEWGVIVGCAGGGNGIVTSRPLEITVVKEPVLYFHSADKQPFSLKVTFNQGNPTETYPDAVKRDKTIEWPRVSFPAPTKAAVAKGLAIDAARLVPFDEILDTLNDTDADEIESGGIKARFLFYEGELPFVNPVKLTTDPQTHEATATNTGAYPVLDLFVFFREEAEEFFFEPKVFFAYLPRLQPGEAVRLKLAPAEAPPDFRKPLRELGFTEKEAWSFEALWEDSFLRYGRLVYRLPEEECNRLIKLEFNPRPKKVSRALYVLVK